MSFASRSLLLAGLGLGLFMAAGAHAQPGAPEKIEPALQAQPVFTRARVNSFLEEAGGKSYVRLKVPPKSKLPFTVQTFRVRDRALMAGIAEGAWVKFTAQHVGGENTVTSIHMVAECQRFQPCD